MDYDLQNFIDILVAILSGFYYSSFMLTVKILAGIYLFVLLVDIILMLILRDVPSHLRVGLRGTDIPLVSKSKMQKRWDKVKKRLKDGNPSQYKVAIIEADAIVEEILDGIGYKGANMTEKLESVGAAHLDDHLESLKGVHLIRNRIVHEADYEIDETTASAVIGVYENFLKYLEFME
ncbi:MAG: hypothetical protein US63_C0016G0030 [Candidatus Moranbacteria bacterium GW2011_GWC2_37_8]|nr:MAG: hypothetical protein US63_C0016G0030 [Candidatus Moranbacteria bacterium GW2011_GWC2_37_8]KKQ62511.1 MAG: hypothetical protein US82_C0010G0031 [Parcubacteria group bacterium GW2011_GWC1_38_22]